MACVSHFGLPLLLPKPVLSSWGLLGLLAAASELLRDAVRSFHSRRWRLRCGFDGGVRGLAWRSLAWRCCVRGARRAKAKRRARARSRRGYGPACRLPGASGSGWATSPHDIISEPPRPRASKMLARAQRRPASAPRRLGATATGKPGQTAGPSSTPCPPAAGRCCAMRHRRLPIRSDAVQQASAGRAGGSQRTARSSVPLTAARVQPPAPPVQYARCRALGEHGSSPGEKLWREGGFEPETRLSGGLPSLPSVC